MRRKKKRDKDRRRARKLADQAWEAADAGNHSLALKIIRRAIELAPGSPLLRRFRRSCRPWFVRRNDRAQEKG